MIPQPCFDQEDDRKQDPERLKQAAQHRCQLYPARAGCRSHMDGPFADCKRRLLNRFRTRRMGVAGARQILGRTTEFHENSRFMDHFTGFAADN
jgi:hypothetical protein